MKKPKTQLQEVLYTLLTNDYVTCKNIMLDTGIINLSARLSDLKLKGVGVELKNIETTNKFGRKIHYGSWSLSDKEHARLQYDTICNDTFYKV